MAGRVTRLSTTFRRTLASIGVHPKTPAYRGVFAAIDSLSNAASLPGVADVQTKFAPGRAFVRRVTGQNVWLLYRFDVEQLFVLTARAEPPVPSDD